MYRWRSTSVAAFIGEPVIGTRDRRGIPATGQLLARGSESLPGVRRAPYSGRGSYRLQRCGFLVRVRALRTRA